MLYYRIDGYLLSIGFTKSGVDPNLYYILVGNDPLILVLYVDDLFLVGVEELMTGCKNIFDCRVRNEGYWLDALLLGVRGMAEIGRNLPWSREVYSRDLEKI